MIRRPLLILATTVLVLSVAASAAWFYAREAAFAAVDAWVADQRTQGTEISWASRTIAGWPLRLDGRFAAPRAIMTTPGRTFDWQGPDAAVRFYIFAPDTVDLAAPGRHTLAIDEDNARTVFTLDAKTLDARTDTGLAAAGPAGTDVAAGATGLDLRGPEDAAIATAQALQITWHQPPVSTTPPESGPLPVALRTALRIDGLTMAPDVLPPTPQPILGNKIAVVRTELAVNGAIDPHRPPPEALAAWRNVGGYVDVTRFEIEWGPVRLVGDGSLALDDALQPEGAFAARVSGLTEILTAMENTNMIDARTAAIARITLAVLTRPSENGGPPEARVPLTIQNSVLSVGPVALLKLPAITWR
jgi:hypothetical protein